MEAILLTGDECIPKDLNFTCRRLTRAVESLMDSRMAIAMLDIKGTCATDGCEALFTTMRGFVSDMLDVLISHLPLDPDETKSKAEAAIDAILRESHEPMHALAADIIGGRLTYKQFATERWTQEFQAMLLRFQAHLVGIAPDALYGQFDC